MTLLGSHVFLQLSPQLQEAQTLRYIFLENSALCYEVTERVVQHLVHSIESRGRHVELLKALQTLVKAEGQSIRKTQDMVMAEVRKFVCLFVCLFCALRNSSENANSAWGVSVFINQENPRYVLVNLIC